MKQPSPAELYILHGWAVDPENEAKWERVRKLLHDKKIPTRFLPIPGLTVPLSENSRAWTLTSYTNWLAEILPDKPVILLGHSFGGQLAVRFTTKYPDRVTALILVASSGIRDRSLLAHMKRIVFYGLAKIGAVFAYIPGATGIFYKLVREQDYYKAPPIMKKTMTNVIGEEIIEDLPQIAVPTLVIWGEKDTITPLRNVAFFKTIPTMELRTIAEARHSPQFTHPDTVADIVATFLKKIVNH